jgi:hypothetical protein
MIIPACCTYHFRFAVIQRSSRLRWTYSLIHIS